jgi:hypothetical protein
VVVAASSLLRQYLGRLRLVAFAGSLVDGSGRLSSVVGSPRRVFCQCVEVYGGWWH